MCRARCLYKGTGTCVSGADTGILEGGGSVMNNQQGEGAGRGVPLPREARKQRRKLMGVPHLCTG